MKMYTVKEVAEILGFCEETIRRKINAGKIKAIKTGKNFKISDENLKEYVENGESKREKNEKEV